MSAMNVVPLEVLEFHFHKGPHLVAQTIFVLQRLPFLNSFFQTFSVYYRQVKFKEA